MTPGVLFVAERMEPMRGGLAVATARIARHALASGERVHVIYPSREVAPGLRGRRERDGLIHHPVGVAEREDDTLFAWASHAEELMGAHDLSLVHGVYATRAGHVATVVAAATGRPSVVSIRGNDLDRGLFRARDLPFVEAALRRATIVTAVSRAHAEGAARLFGRSVEHVTNAVDTEVFRPQGKDTTLEASLGLKGRAVLGFLGELRDKKGMRFLLPAFDAVLSRRPVSLLLIGGVRDDARVAFDHFRERAGSAAEHIHVTGYERDPERLCRLLGLCDLMVFPSLLDGTPNAMLEAMATRRLILATAVGGQQDLIEHGVSGALMPRADLDLLPEAIEEMLDLSEAERGRMTRRARERVEAHHRPEQEREAYAALYRRARGG